MLRHVGNQEEEYNLNTHQDMHFKQLYNSAEWQTIINMINNPKRDQTQLLKSDIQRTERAIKRLVSESEYEDKFNEMIKSFEEKEGIEKKTEESGVEKSYKEKIKGMFS